MSRPRTLRGGAIAGFEIAVNGKVLDSSVQVEGITVRLALDQAQTARIILLDGDAAGGAFTLSESSAFMPGDSLTISIGYDGQLKRVFSGVVGGLGIQASESSGGRLIVSATGETPSPASGSSPVMALVYGVSIFELDLAIAPGSHGHWAEPATCDGSLRIQGSALATPGCTVTLSGLGARFEGDAPVHGVQHDLAEGNWLTRLAFGEADLT
ncbi:MAG: hypothetical protein GC145_08140 [Caulobacter sp.]|nr:hypothetical protein [Caulobacter sp.]